MSDLNNDLIIKELLHLLPLHVFWKDISGVYRGCNRLLAQGLGFASEDEVIGKTDYDLPIDKKMSDLYRQDDLLVIESKTAKLNIEEEQTFINGKKGYLLTSKVPLFDQAGVVIGILGVYIDITERKLTEQELLKSRNAAESANRAKTEFLANMSHDIKTPMTGVVSVADLMMHVPAWCTPEKAKIIHSSGSQVLNFFNSCLELSKLEMSEFSSAEEAFSLKTLFEEIYALFLPRAQSKNLKFSIDYDADLPLTLLGHRSSVYRVILNLVGNALKFTETGEVQLRAFLAESLNEKNIRVGIEIKDTGIGIPDDKQGIIFEKLRRLTPSYKGKVEGSGIGLYIVDQYVKRMNGDINVESDVGKGSTFTVLLPMTIASNLFAFENKKETALLSEVSLSSHISPPTIASTSSFTHEKMLAEDAPRILLVEDNPMVQMATSALLNDTGFRVEMANSGEEAVEMFSPEKYDLIYMDIGLPNMNGYEATQAIRAKERTKNAAKKVPIIALTGHGAVDVQAFCGQAGMQGILSKPLTREQAESVWRRYGKGGSAHVPGLILITD